MNPSHTSATPATLRAAEAARILSVSTETLRLWEQGGKLPFEVARTPGGQRCYPAAQIHDLARRIREGGGSSAALDAMQEMVLVPQMQDMGGGVFAEHDGEGGIGYWGGMSRRGQSVEPDDPYIDQAAVPQREATMPEGVAMVSLAYFSDGTPCLAGTDQSRYGGQSVSIGLAITGGAHAGRVATLRLDFCEGRRGEAARRWLAALVGDEIAAQARVDVDVLAEAFAPRIYALGISERAADPFGFEGVRRELTIGQLYGQHEIEPSGTLQQLPGADAPAPETRPDFDLMDDFGDEDEDDFSF
jgi:hypothetical protein